ncbi:Predicted arabinose efflux permease, MFS family [Tessaracoccus bendigoensis DSM 12906]|uniref:Predicted arabinose efflux permease, MFS family n=1 Tax=Tessaracoccus bendigoensis DSM 12906 TaxID=1123357 RepID=A0A1M6IF62_9ACTN|nr:MFS transporter [Tessaracoccus bendigoensis]SHJ33114.1 Predicted arabinose efflux permease, MFS family [Tessaracoccus bendigoensis DSM 12906]
MKANWSLLRDPQFARLFGARTASMGGSAFAPVALAFGVLHLPGGDSETLSWVLTAESVPMIAFLLFGGVIADRFPRQKVMMAGEFCSATAFASLGILLLGGNPPLWQLCVAAALSGIGIATMMPALTGVIPEVLKPHQLQSGNALLALGANTARIAGLVFAGAIVTLVGGAWALLGAAALFATSGTVVSGLRGLTDRRGAASGSTLSDLRDGWREFSSRQWIWVVVLQFSFLVLLFQACFGVLGPVLADTELGGPGAWSWILAGDAVGMVLGVLIAMRVRPRRPILVGVLLTTLATPPFLALGLGAPLWVVVPLAIVMGGAFDVFGVLWNTTMQRLIPAEALSRVAAYDAFGSLMFGPVGLLLAGHAVVWWGARPSMVAAALLMLVTVALALLSPEVRSLRAPDAEENVGDIVEAR